MRKFKCLAWCFIAMLTMPAVQASRGDFPFVGSDKLTKQQIVELLRNIEQAANTDDLNLTASYYAPTFKLDVTTEFDGQKTREVVDKQQWFAETKAAMQLVQNYQMKLVQYEIFDLANNTAKVRGVTRATMVIQGQQINSKSSGVSYVQLINGEAKITFSKSHIVISIDALTE